MTKTDIELKNITQDQTFSTLISFLNESNIVNLIEEVLEVTQNDEIPFDEDIIIDKSRHIQLINKMYKNYRKDITIDDKIMLKSVVCLAFECLNIILSMIYTQTLNEKSKTVQGKIPIHQHHQRYLNPVQYIKDALLTTSSLAADLDENKLMLTIIAYIDFENRYDFPVNKRKTDESFESSITSYETHLNLSSVAFRTVIEVMRIWELFPISKRPSLSYFLTYDNHTFSAVDEMIRDSMDNPETAY